MRRPIWPKIINLVQKHDVSFVFRFVFIVLKGHSFLFIIILFLKL